MAKRGEKVAYTVSLDEGSKRWNMARNGVPTGGFATVMATAIGLAYREASLEQAGSNKDVRVYSVGQDGKWKQEWPI